MKYFFAILIALSLNAHATTTELKHYNDLDRNSLEGAVVVFDIDNTLLRQNSMIGTHQWGDDMRERFIKHGMDEESARDKQLELFTQIQSLIEVVPVEESVRELLKYLDGKKIPHFALTARPSVATDVTIKQLAVLNHDFAKSFPVQRDPMLLKGYLTNGVIFSGGTPKGELLKTIVENSKVRPTKIVFIDDKQYNLDSVEASLQGSGIQVQTYRYGGADAVVAAYDRKIADLEFSFLQENPFEVISDQSASRIYGDFDQMNKLRLADYQAGQGPLVTTGDCRVVQSEVSYLCDYVYDGEKAELELKYSRDPDYGTIVFGGWE